MLADDTNPAALPPKEFARLVKQTPADDLKLLMQGSYRKAVLDKIFERMPDVFRPERARGMTAVVHWRIGDRPDGGTDTYELAISDGACQVSAAPTHEPKLALTISAVDFLKVVTGNANPMTLFLRGRMKAKGDLGLATRFPTLFDIPKS
jgi:putative sterol carrier protein